MFDDELANLGLCIVHSHSTVCIGYIRNPNNSLDAITENDVDLSDGSRRTVYLRRSTSDYFHHAASFTRPYLDVTNFAPDGTNFLLEGPKPLDTSLRSVAKSLDFGFPRPVFGGRPSVWPPANFSAEDAQRIVDEFDRAFPELVKFMKRKDLE